MTNLEIQENLKRLIQDERKLTNEILNLINLAEERKLFLEHGYGSLFDWLTSYFGYSEAAAQRRIQAARLLKVVPDVANKISTGEVNLTTLAKAQSFIRQQEKVSGQRLTISEKSEVVQSIENKSGNESQRTLMEKFPEVAKTINQETKIRLDANTQRLSVNLSDDVISKLEQIKLLLSYTLPDGKMADIINYVATEFLSKKNKPSARATTPDRKSEKENEKNQKSRLTYTAGSATEELDKTNGNTAAAKHCVNRKPVKISIRKQVMGGANRECEYVDPHSKRKCKSKFQLEVDHIKPRALGGNNEIGNLRCLCRAHNQLMAQKIFGERAKMFSPPK